MKTQNSTPPNFQLTKLSNKEDVVRDYLLRVYPHAQLVLNVLKIYKRGTKYNLFKEYENYCKSIKDVSLEIIEKAYNSYCEANSRFQRINHPNYFIKIVQNLNGSIVGENQPTSDKSKAWSTRSDDLAPLIGKVI